MNVAILKSILPQILYEGLIIKTKLLPFRGWGLTKQIKWQYHKNPEAGSTDHQAEVLNPAVVDSTKAVSGEDLPPAKKQNIVSIILSEFPRFG